MNDKPKLAVNLEPEPGMAQMGAPLQLKSALKKKPSPTPLMKTVYHRPNKKTFLVVNLGNNQENTQQKRTVRFNDEPQIFILYPPPPEVTLECHDCAFGFDTRESYDAHFREVHPVLSNPELVQVESESQPEPETKEGELKCYIPDCDQRFKTVPDAKIHLQEVHGERPPNLVSCQKCGQLEPNTRKLHQHQTTVHVQHVKCNMCGRRFISPGEKKEHLKVVHGLEDDNGKCVEHGEAVFLKRVFESHFRVKTGKQLLLT